MPTAQEYQAAFGDPSLLSPVSSSGGTKRTNPLAQAIDVMTLRGLIDERDIQIGRQRASQQFPNDLADQARYLGDIGDTDGSNALGKIVDERAINAANRQEKDMENSRQVFSAVVNIGNSLLDKVRLDPSHPDYLTDDEADASWVNMMVQGSEFKGFEFFRELKDRWGDAPLLVAIGEAIQKGQDPTNFQRVHEFLLGLGLTQKEALDNQGGPEVVVNVGTEDEEIPHTELRYMVDPGTGLTPEPGTTRQEARELGAVFVTPTQRKALDAASTFGPVFDQLTELALGESGVFTGIEPGFLNRLGEAWRLALMSFSREDPRPELYDSIVNGAIVPFIKQLGATGALSDLEMQNGIALFPQIRGDFFLPDTREEAIRKLMLVRDILQKGLLDLQAQTGVQIDPALLGLSPNTQSLLREVTVNPVGGVVGNGNETPPQSAPAPNLAGYARAAGESLLTVPAEVSNWLDKNMPWRDGALSVEALAGQARAAGGALSAAQAAVSNWLDENRPQMPPEVSNWLDKNMPQGALPSASGASNVIVPFGDLPGG